jgi:hypothetical protein
LSPMWLWFVRSGVPASALLISGGFFFSAMGKGVMRPNSWIAMLYAGVFILAAAMIALGVGLLN